MFTALPTRDIATTSTVHVLVARGARAVQSAGIIPDVIHANDWQTALVPVYLNTVEWMKPLHASASVYTIHNLAHQGIFDERALFVTGSGTSTTTLGSSSTSGP